MSILRLRSSVAAGLASYSTSFDTTENPISEGGQWFKNSGNVWQEIETTGGLAIAAAYTEDVDDAYAYLKNWTGGDDYEIQAVTASGLNAGEVELLMRVSDNATQVAAYEFLYNTGGSWSLVRWNGDHTDYVQLQTGGTPDSGNGSQLRCTCVGNLFNLYWRAAGDTGAWTSLLTDYADTGVSGGIITTGKPGLAIYVHAASANISYTGFQSYSVVAL